MSRLRRWSRLRRSSSYKVCTKCKAVNNVKAKDCWNCGNTIFTSRWDGMVMIISGDSALKEVLGVDKEGYYAIKVL